MKPTPAKSEGARYERAALRNYLRREIQKAKYDLSKMALQEVLGWVLTRQKRYDKKPGGL